MITSVHSKVRIFDGFDIVQKFGGETCFSFIIDIMIFLLFEICLALSKINDCNIYLILLWQASWGISLSSLVN